MAPYAVREHGFSLIEMAFALFMIALLLGSLLVPLGTQVDKRHYAETEKQIEHIREALIGFALINRYLPCPAISATNGREDRTGNTCTLVAGNPKRVGFVPWVTLGVSPADAWDNLFRYSVDPDFAVSNPNSYFTLSDVGDIQIHTRDSTGTEIDLTNVEIPATVISHGKNGLSATSSSGVTRPVAAPVSNADEAANATSASAFYFRQHSEGTAAGGNYDDIVAWISLNQLFARMVSAGRLP